MNDGGINRDGAIAKIFFGDKRLIVPLQFSTIPKIKLGKYF